MKTGVWILAAALAAATAAFPGDWTTFGGDAQRSGLASREDLLTRESAPKLKLEWKLAIDNKSKELTSLAVPVIVSGVPAPGGFRDFVIVAGSDDDISAIDGDTGKLIWRKKFQITGTPVQNPGWLCPNALTATPVIDRRKLDIYALASDGQLHTLNVVDGEDMQPPRQMTPPFAKTWSLNLVNGVLYTATSQGCNSVISAVYAMSAGGGEPKSFPAMHGFGAGIWGRAGVAIGTDGTVYAETGDGKFDPAAGQYPDSVLAVDGKTLALKDYFTPKNNRWIWKKDLDMGNMSPVVFPYKGKQLIAASGKEGAIFLLDSASLGGADHQTPAYDSGLLTNAGADFAGHGFWGAFSTWEDAKGARWLYAPAWGPPTPDTKFPVSYGDTPQGSVMAFQVTGPADKPVLTPAWNSVNMSVPEPVAIVNGVVFALSNGENVNQVSDTGRLLDSDYRATHPSGRAILYAFDSETGKVLYSSGDVIPGFSHFSGLAIADGRVFVATWDDTLYAFGLGQE